MRLPRGRLIAALLMAVVAAVSYFSLREYNPVTEEVQRVAITVDQEIALGLQAAPELIRQFGGPSASPRHQDLVERVGRKILEQGVGKETPYRFEFHALGDRKTVNAFALPGGQVFITDALLEKLRTEGELAGVLGHEIAHVVARHGAEHIAKAQLAEGLTGAAVIATYDPNDPSSARTGQMAALIAQLVTMRFGREDELESDRLGVRFMSQAGYDPRGMIGVMEVLSRASEGQAPPEFFSTHPNPDRRIERIQEAIREIFPEGIPDGLIK